MMKIREARGTNRREGQTLLLQTGSRSIFQSFSFAYLSVSERALSNTPYPSVHFSGPRAAERSLRMAMTLDDAEATLLRAQAWVAKGLVTQQDFDEAKATILEKCGLTKARAVVLLRCRRVQ